MKKKKTITIIAIVIAIAIVVTGGIAAYLTDTDSATNTFTVGKVEISLTEPNWNASNGQNILPGQTVAKDPMITNTGRNTAYVYMKVEQPLVDSEYELWDSSIPSHDPLFSYTTNSGWTFLGNYMTSGCNTLTSVYYYNTSLAPNASTSKLFNNVTVGDFDQDIETGNKNIVVTGYAIQSTNLPSGTTIQSAFNEYFKEEVNTACYSNPIYRWSTTHWTRNQHLGSFTPGTDFVRKQSQLINMNALASKFYLKYDILNNIVDDEYVCFVVTPEMKQSNPDMTIGEYCLRGGDEDGPDYLNNIDVLLSAYGSSNCGMISGDYYSNCDVSSLHAYIIGGLVIIRDNNGNACNNDNYGGDSYCDLV